MKYCEYCGLSEDDIATEPECELNIDGHLMVEDDFPMPTEEELR